MSRLDREPWSLRKLRPKLSQMGKDGRLGSPWGTNISLRTVSTDFCCDINPRIYKVFPKMSESKNDPHYRADIGKADVEATEAIHKPVGATHGKDKAAELLASTDRIVVTSAENKRVLRKIDLVILPILLSVYFLQSLDKTTLSYASVFGLITDAGLDPNSTQYSWLGSIVYIAQLVMQPVVAVLLVKLRMGKFMGVMVFTWGCILCGMAGAKNFTGLMATRFLLGAFESAVGMLTPLRVYVKLITFSTCFHRCCSNVVQAH